jgi:altronate hydrolase
MRRVLALDRRDNVANALEPLARGDRVEAFGRAAVVRTDIARGHKIALVPIATGEAIVKYGEEIARARCDIAAGEHVHTHNVERLFHDWLAARSDTASQ